MVIASLPWDHLLIRIQQRGLKTFGCRKVEAWESRWKCWQSIPFGTLKKVRVALKYKYTKAKAVKVLATFPNVCCAYLNFNLKIKAMHDKYWSEIIFIWLQSVPSASRVGVSVYQLIHSRALMTNEKESPGGLGSWCSIRQRPVGSPLVLSALQYYLQPPQSDYKGLSAQKVQTCFFQCVLGALTDASWSCVSAPKGRSWRTANRSWLHSCLLAKFYP